jgi:alpha-beta hydrolase superfamily lysophospholipase
MALRHAVSEDQIIVAVGYSMGAIILNNYVSSYGSEVPLDGAIAISGGLDMRYQEDFARAQRLWQPMLTETARDDFFLGKWGHRVKARLSESNFLKLMRSKHITVSTVLSWKKKKKWLLYLLGLTDIFTLFCRNLILSRLPPIVALMMLDITIGK